MLLSGCRLPTLSPFVSLNPLLKFRITVCMDALVARAVSRRNTRVHTPTNFMSIQSQMLTNTVVYQQVIWQHGTLRTAKIINSAISYYFTAHGHWWRTSFYVNICFFIAVFILTFAILLCFCLSWLWYIVTEAILDSAWQLTCRSIPPLIRFLATGVNYAPWFHRDTASAAAASYISQQWSHCQSV